MKRMRATLYGSAFFKAGIGEAATEEANMGKYQIPRASLDVSRRIFLHRSAAILGGALLASPVFAAKLGCRPTASDILGPFYRFGAPFRARLAGPDEPGDRLVLTGTVFGSDCRTPSRGH